ncbi:uncharacterized protein BCR38DRAFT_103206 [Pseudomassariella vexata]|uniref:Uncharacterized protein n=1 Tax=Pseudomassariella vexata TaxID=1141098 RepID=A0A1Y2EFA7_9PEZI|nr:uncharacterized protein BCR38DRAFT_103206 [Pseudomassariella vexata]ORY70261.1 hypothetical protein BCR38DRAFT_103206 [Pseudomassariella vexata]
MMSGGVKNLRAMFEQRGSDNAPEDRGRSPAPSNLSSNLSLRGTPTPSQSPRPLSKVRTAFVAVEKDGRIELVLSPHRPRRHRNL